MKIVSQTKLLKITERWRRCGETFSFTNGVFDLTPHPGHIYSLEETAKKADHLIVGVNSDSSARMLNKGPGRPRLSAEERAGNIARLEMVSLVTIFEEETPYELLSELKPDVLAKGDDYKPEEVVGREFANELLLIPRLEGHSTTALDAELKVGNG